MKPWAGNCFVPGIEAWLVVERPGQVDGDWGRKIDAAGGRFNTLVEVTRQGHAGCSLEAVLLTRRAGSSHTAIQIQG